MKLKRILFGALALLLVLVVIVPAVVNRVSWEQTSKVYVAGVDVSRLIKYFDDDELPQVLADYKAAGVTTAVFNETRGVYQEAQIKMADDAGMYIALAPDVTIADDADLERLVQEYNVKYIKLQKSITKVKTEDPAKSAPVCDVIDHYDLTLVVTETIWQLANAEPVNYDDYLEAADGKILRTFNTYGATNVEQMDYPATYYQMYNSAYDRNARFITVKQLDDAGFSAAENAVRTQENVRLFCDKMESHGFICDGDVNYNAYQVHTTRTSAAAAAIGVLMLALMIELLAKKNHKWLLPAGLVLTAAVFVGTFVLPAGIIGLYPTVFATLAPCFCITVCAVYVRNRKTRMGFWPLLLSAAGISLATLLLSGSVLVAMLSGPEYFLNDYVFRGVKLSLIIPILYTCCLVLASVYQKRTLAEYKARIKKALHSIRWYHILLIVAVLAVAALYVIRSGNVNSISFAEVNIRNTLTEIFAARPRTKEFLLGWPCLVLFIYYAKRDIARPLKYIFALGASILFASTVNTFCHVFTMAETMYLRVATGLLFGAVLSMIALGINCLIVKLVLRCMAKSKSAE